MKKLTLTLLICAMTLTLAACGGSSGSEEDTSKDWKTSFSEAGFSEDEIAEYETVLTTIGVTDLHDVEIIDNDPMHIVIGKIFDSDNLQLNMTLENCTIIYAEIAGIPDTKTEAYINWRGQLKTKTVDTVTSVEMYSDTEGGYLAVLDWKSKTISEYEGG